MATTGAEGSAASTARRYKPRSLQSHLLVIVFVALLPLVVFSVSVVSLFARLQYDTFRRGATDRTRSMLTAIDTELKRSIAALEALGKSRHLLTQDVASFRMEAERVLAGRAEWVTIALALPDGTQIMDLRQPQEAALRAIADRPSVERVLREHAPAVGDLVFDEGSGQYEFSVRVPVVQDQGDVVILVLSARVKTDTTNALLSAQGLPSDWVGVVLDGNRRIVARTVSPATSVGKPGSGSLVGALEQSPEGWFHGRTLEGWDVYTPYHRSTFSGWTVALGIPAAVVEAPLQRSLLYMISLFVLLLGLGVLLALVLSRRTARSIEETARTAKEIGTRPGAVADRPAPPTGIAEVQDLREALVRAAQVIQQRMEERDRVENSLRTAETRLRESDRHKDYFLATLGHELRNPLGIISTVVQLLRNRVAGDDELNDLRLMMERQVEHMTRLLDDLLDVSRIAQGRIQISKKLCDLSAIVRDTANDHVEAYEKAGLALDLAVPDHPLWIMGDRTRLAQAVTNLLNNAEKFTDAGGKVAVRLVETADGEAATLTVKDTGVGMDGETLEQAFRAFSQADRTLDRSRGGLGLGLALVKGLVELHGGVVRAASEGIGHGTEVRIRLPLEPAVIAPPDDAEPSAVGTARPRRVLVIEDNRMAASTLQMYLADLGHEVEVAHSGPDGVETALRFRPEVVLCDIGLPDLDGYEVAKRLRGEPRLRDTMLVAITGYGQDGDRQRALAAGFHRFLTKPIRLDRLGKLLAELEPV